MTPQEIKNLELWRKTIDKITATWGNDLDDLYIDDNNGPSVFIRLDDMSIQMEAMLHNNNIQLESYLFKLTTATLKYFGIKADSEDISELVMTELINIKK